MNLILLGMPGSGKGTQAKMISEKYHIPKISTGDIFREVLQGDSSLAKKIRKYVDNGKFVNDEIVFDVVKERINRSNCSGGFLLDGFPRNINQAETFDRYIESFKKPVPDVMYLELSFEVSIKRLISRRNCPVCNKSYNLLSMPPAKDEICDVCNVKLISRKDDDEATVRNRVKVFESETEPLVDYYGSRPSRFFKINADNTIEAVFENICSLLDKVA
jgi:adenylate kinase